MLSMYKSLGSDSYNCQKNGDYNFNAPEFKLASPGNASRALFCDYSQGKWDESLKEVCDR